jgi:hypothetical protein
MAADRVLDVELADVGMDDHENPDRPAVSEAQAVGDPPRPPSSPSKAPSS